MTNGICILINSARTSQRNTTMKQTQFQVWVPHSKKRDPIGGFGISNVIEYGKLFRSSFYIYNLTVMTSCFEKK